MLKTESEVENYYIQHSECDDISAFANSMTIKYNREITYYCTSYAAAAPPPYPPLPPLITQTDKINQKNEANRRYIFITMGFDIPVVPFRLPQHKRSGMLTMQNPGNPITTSYKWKTRSTNDKRDAECHPTNPTTPTKVFLL